MNLIFLTLSPISSFEAPGIYTDLLRAFIRDGHSVYVIRPTERRYRKSTSLSVEGNAHILSVRTLNIQKTNVVEKGIGTLLLEWQFARAVKRYYAGVKFDLILYSTPPITFCNVVRTLKQSNSTSVSYLLLKDIFPQNAVDIGMLREGGLLHQYFRRKEVALYRLSDFIGCMSPANVQYLLQHNEYISSETAEVAPNSIELPRIDNRKDIDRNSILKKYGLPIDMPLFIYGGNLGKPQGVDYLIKCLDANKERNDCHFIVVGSGTEQPKIQSWYDTTKPKNVTCLQSLPKDDYDILVKLCNVGLIFLDHRFTIPNYPSRLLSYLEYKRPILVATDRNCDMGSIAESNGYGYWCESVKVEDFTAILNKMLSSDMEAMGKKGFDYLCTQYLVENTYQTIMKHV